MANKKTQSTPTKAPKAIARVVLLSILRDCESNKELKSAFDSNDLSRCMEIVRHKKLVISRTSAAILAAALDILIASSLIKRILVAATSLGRSLLSDILKVAKVELSIEFHESILVEDLYTGAPRPVVWYRNSYLQENKKGKNSLRLRSSGGRKNVLESVDTDFSDYSKALDEVGVYRNSKHRLQLIDEELLSEIVIGFEKIVAGLISAYEKADTSGKSFSRIDRAIRDLELPKKRNQLIADLVNWRIGMDEPSEPQDVKQFKQMKFTARQIENRLNPKKNKRLR